MPRRHILTERQRAALFDLPILEADLHDINPVRRRGWWR